jgi:hypothetical protein
MMKFKEHKNEKSFEKLEGIFCDGFLIRDVKSIFN